MAKIIQVRDVPDDVHSALAQAAEAERLSLNRYVLRELEHVARRAALVAANARVVSETRDRIASRVGRDEILAALHEGRDE